MTNGNTNWFKLKPEEIRALRGITYTFALLLFDCEREQFKTMELPQQLIPNRQNQYVCNSVQLFTYREMVAALQQASWYGDCYALWVMEEHGVASSWKKLFNIGEQHSGRYIANHVLVLREDGIVSQPSVEELPYRIWESVEKYRLQPLNGQAFAESLFLMDVKEQHQGEDGQR